jgi:hypothetical protein
MAACNRNLADAYFAHYHTTADTYTRRIVKQFTVQVCRFIITLCYRTIEAKNILAHAIAL